MKINPTLAGFIVFLVVVVILGVLVFSLRPMAITFRPVVFSDITQLLSSLFLISLFLERAIEVFITVWRGPEAKMLETRMHAAQLVVADQKKAFQGTVDANKMQTALQESDNAKEDFVQFKSATQRWALWTGFIMGLAISLVGVHTLNILVTQESYAALSSQQKSLFDIVDILITGGLVGGGSDGVHKILQLFFDFIDATSNRVNAPHPPAG